MNSLNITLRLYSVFSICIGVSNCHSIQLRLNIGSPCPNGICMPLEKCQSAKDLIARRKQPTICSFVGYFRIPIVCCQNNKTKIDIENKSLTTKTTYDQDYEEDQALTTETTYDQDYDQDYEDDQTVTTETITDQNTTENQTKLKIGRKSISEQKCDEYAKIFVHRYGVIVRGQNAAPGEFPHMALIGYEDGNNIEWLCGGSLISERYVLTAAHCSFTPDLGSAKYIKLGVWNILNESEYPNTFSIEQIIIHPDYKPPSNYHDIALIKLNATAQFNRSRNRVKPACLNMERNITNLHLIATGWGATGYGDEPSTLLQKVTLDLFPQERCNRTYYRQSMRRLPNGIVDDYQICAGSFNDEKDACQGDSGGPLQAIDLNMDDDRVIYIIGITSFGKTCGVANIPGVYTRVSTYVPWIERIVWST